MGSGAARSQAGELEPIVLRPRAPWTRETTPATVIPMKNLNRIEEPAETRFEAPDPDDCKTMLDVRAGVDEIDRMLVALITRRQGYMHAAARIKPSRDVVRDEARINQVLANVKAEAERSGLSWAIAEPVWREMMERCIAHEFDVWDATRV